MEAAKNRAWVEHVCGLFAPTLLRDIREHLNAIEAQRQALAKSEREQAAIDRGESSDALRMDPRWYDVWCHPTQRMLDMVRPWTWVIFPPQVRIVRQVAHSVPWHQDAAYQKLLGSRGHRRCITCFTPLDDDPARRTTLQFCRDELRELEHIPLDGFGAGVAKLDCSKLEHYDLELGDCLIFGDLALHRTFVPHGAGVERRSLEFRLVRPNETLFNKDYFDIESGRFVQRAID